MADLQILQGLNRILTFANCRNTHSAFESTLNSSVVSYRIVFDHVVRSLTECYKLTLPTTCLFIFDYTQWRI